MYLLSFWPPDSETLGKYVTSRNQSAKNRTCIFHAFLSGTWMLQRLKGMMDVHGITAAMLEVYFMEFVLSLWCNKHPIPFSLARQLFTPEKAFSCTIYWMYCQNRGICKRRTQFHSVTYSVTLTFSYQTSNSSSVPRVQHQAPRPRAMAWCQSAQLWSPGSETRTVPLSWKNGCVSWFPLPATCFASLHIFLANSLLQDIDR